MMNLKIAIVTESIMEFGGADRVTQAFLKMFPEADLYTSCFDRNVLATFYPRISPKKIHVSWLQNTPFKNRTSLHQLLSPFIWKGFNFEKFNVIISGSSYMLGNLISARRLIHIQYIHCLPKNLFGLSPPKKLQRIFPYSGLLKKIYRKAVSSSKYIIANSWYTQQLLYKMCQINSEVIYPPIRVPKSFSPKRKENYFICVSRLDRIKNLELAIHACNYLKLPFKIVGKSTDKIYEKFLKSIAGSTVQFLGFRTDNEVTELYQSARGFIFPAENEDFGIAPVEAMAHGLPVIAYYGGGLKETVIPKKTGLFFYRHNINSLVQALTLFKKIKFNPEIIYNHAKKFSEEVFFSKMKGYLNKIISNS